MRGKLKGLISIICVIALTFSFSAVYAEDTGDVAETAVPQVPELLSLDTNNNYKSITVNWTSEGEADGYEIYCKPSGKARTIYETYSDGQETISGLMRNKKYTIKIRSFIFDGDSVVRSKWSRARTTRTEYTDWQSYLDKYASDESVNEMVLVKYRGGSRATLMLYQKDAGGLWQELLRCKAYTGKRGIGKTKEGDLKTPKGDYRLTCAFGIKDDPGSAMEYTKVTRYHYWCADKYYNTMVDVRIKKHKCHGEHLIHYTRSYAYAMNIGYNLACKKGKGSALFLHCFGSHKYTRGCVAVSRSDMKTIIQTCGEGSRICIYRR